MRLGASGEGWLELVAEGSGERSGGNGRKLQAEEGRCETRVKISEIRRCWTDVSWVN